MSKSFKQLSRLRFGNSLTCAELWISKTLRFSGTPPICTIGVEDRSSEYIVVNMLKSKRYFMLVPLQLRPSRFWSWSTPWISLSCSQPEKFNSCKQLSLLRFGNSLTYAQLWISKTLRFLGRPPICSMGVEDTSSLFNDVNMLKSGRYFMLVPLQLRSLRFWS